MEPFKGGRACARLAIAFAAALMLTACSSGGGSNASAGGGSTPAPTLPAPTFATQTTGTLFTMNGALLIYLGSGFPTSIGLVTGSLQYAGTNASGVPLYNVVSPTGTYNAQPTDGTVIQSINNGTQTSALTLANLTYTAIGTWTVRQAGAGSNYPMAFSTGFQTPTTGVPASGSATYLAPGNGVLGTVFIPAGIGTAPTATLAGQASIGINFSTGLVNGTLSNMNATATSGGAVTPWNGVTLTGTLSGSAFGGTTATAAPPAGAGSFGLAANSTGNFQGALYGPNAQELGLSWTLSEPGAALTAPTTAKISFGAVMATKQ